MRWRRAFTRGSIWASGGACVVVLAAWGFSVLRGPSWTFSHDFIGVAKGGLYWKQLSAIPRSTLSSDPTSNDAHHVQVLERRISEGEATFQLTRLRRHGWIWTPSLSREDAVVPFWLVFAPPAGMLALLLSAQVRAHGRVRGWRCPACGYDRRGLAADAKCPECGTVPAPASK